jgi:hypothetical protein
MKLGRSLIEGEFDNCFILTFNADLAFFEEVVFGELYSNGCRNIVILMDPGHCAEELKNSIPILNYVGQRYVCTAATGVAGVRFHPKLILQTSEKRGRLFLGSGNLTLPGLTRNWEVVTCLEYDSNEPDQVIRTAFQAVLDYAQRLSRIDGIPSIAHRGIARLIKSTPWANPAFHDAGSLRALRILDNLEHSLWEQVRATVPTPLRQVRIVSPFFDPACTAFERLFEDLQPESVCLYIQPGQHNLDPRRLRAALTHYGGEFEVRALHLDGRRLHAKAMLFEGEQGAWLLTGSANFSVAGMMRSARLGNAELGILRHEADPRYFDGWWGELRQHSSAIDVNWDVPSAGDEPPDEQPAMRPEILLKSATLSDSGTLQLDCLGQLPAEIRRVWLTLEATTTSRLDAHAWQSTGSVISMHLPDVWRQRLESPWLVTLGLETSQGTQTSSPILVHHLGQLSRYSHPPRKYKPIPIPEDLIPEDQTVLLDLMQLFERLFIPSPEVNPSPGPRSGHKGKGDQDDSDVPDEDYDPDEHVAAEKVRDPTGANYLPDREDRRSFRDLMRQALKASYLAPEPLRAPRLPGTGPKDKRKKRDDGSKQKERLMAEMARGFQKLVNRFGESVEDIDSFSRIPPKYMCDFYCGVMQFLGVVQHHELIAMEQYAQFASALLISFYGTPGRVGVWQELQRLHPQSELEIPRAHWQIHERSWVLFYQCWCLLGLPEFATPQPVDLRWRLGAIARRVLQEIGGKGELHRCASFLQQQAIQLWPEDTDRPDYDAFHAVLVEASEHYHIDLLGEELRLMGASSVVVKQPSSTSPDLHVTIPLRDTETDHLLNAFQGFVKINRSRPGIQAMRAQFMESRADLKRRERTIILRYDVSGASLLYAVRYKAPGGPYTYEVATELVSLSLENLLGFRSFKDVLDWTQQSPIPI